MINLIRIVLQVSLFLLLPVQLSAQDLSLEKGLICKLTRECGANEQCSDVDFPIFILPDGQGFYLNADFEDRPIYKIANMAPKLVFVGTLYDVVEMVTIFPDASARYTVHLHGEGFVATSYSGTCKARR